MENDLRDERDWVRKCSWIYLNKVEAGSCSQTISTSFETQRKEKSIICYFTNI